MHTLEDWLTVLTAVGLLAGGYACLVARTLNRACRVAARPALWIESVYEPQQGKLTRWQRAVWAVSVRTNAGAWPRDRLSLGEWTAAGTIVGATLGFVGYWIHVAVTPARLRSRSRGSGRTIGAMTTLGASGASPRWTLSEPRGQRWRRFLFVVIFGSLATAGAITIAHGLGASESADQWIAVALVALVAGIGIPVAALGAALHGTDRSFYPAPLRPERSANGVARYLPLRITALLIWAFAAVAGLWVSGLIPFGWLALVALLALVRLFFRGAIADVSVEVHAEFDPPTRTLRTGPTHPFDREGPDIRVREEDDSLDRPRNRQAARARRRHNSPR